jgi:diguanylate cyclase (GGDEF)-like protein
MTMPPLHGSAHRRLLQAGLLAACVIALIATTLAMLRVAAERLLERDAGHTALAWADYLGHSVDLERLLQARVLDDDTRVQLKKLTHVREVFRFKLFDPHGALLLVSDDLDKAAAVALPGRRRDGGHGNATLMATVLAGNTSVALQRNAQAGRPAVYAEAYVPLRAAGSVLGVVEVYVDQVEREQRIQEAFATVAAAVFLLLAAVSGLFGWQWVQRMRGERAAEERALYLAHHDALTGTLNRTSFNEALQQAERHYAAGGPGFAVLCLDLDRFQHVNDSLGQDAGDQVLRQVSARLEGLVRTGDKVARLGGDEFAILRYGVRGAHDVVALAQRVVESLALPYELARQPVRCGVSVGAALVRSDAPPERDSILGDAMPDEDTAPQPLPPPQQHDLLHQADVALYRAKAAGGGGFSFYDADLDLQLRQRRELTSDLREAIGRNQLSLHYQPLIRSEGGTLAGYEALLRWQHPLLGLVPPGEFIPLAEDDGLIDAIGHWVLRNACREAAGWPAPLTVAVNLSPAQFRRESLVDEVLGALQAAGLAPARLELEITESLLMDNTAQVIGTLQALAGLGVQISMDDFGTGYSSLAYLWKFPFNKVKIDRAFTRHLEDDPKVRLIVKSIIALAHSLQIRVNAEGVETPGQAATLQAYGCDELQGFLLGRPAPAGSLPHQEPLVQPAGRLPARAGAPHPPAAGPERVQRTAAVPGTRA